MVEHNADCDASDIEDCLMPLHQAAILGFVEAVEYLIPRMSNTNAL